MAGKFFTRGNQLLRKATTTFLIILSMFASAVTETPSLATSSLMTSSLATTSQARAEQAATFDERLGADDGAALAILISANERGNIEVCD